MSGQACTGCLLVVSGGGYLGFPSQGPGASRGIGHSSRLRFSVEKWATPQHEAEANIPLFDISVYLIYDRQRFCSIWSFIKFLTSISFMLIV